MSRLFKELSIIEFSQSSNKNTYIINIRNVDKSQEQKKFNSFNEVVDYYRNIDSDKKEAIEEIKIEDLKEDVNLPIPDIAEYVKTNIDKKGVKSARHLNKKFDLKNTQKVILKTFKVNEYGSFSAKRNM